jgi:hypothetical protein
VGKNLAEFLLGHTQDSAIMPEGDGARAGGALVEGEHGLHLQWKMGSDPLVLAAMIR